mmetsp:Transcript_36971/g.44168  ORF Transcript_36971/g.44168 Transcript_36971/m.44168 type:complete len:226 (+) Transcript_36971:266-943(+)
MEPHPDFREVNISLPRAWLNVGLRVEGVLVVLVVVDVDCSLLAADCDSLLLLLLFLLFCDDSKFLATASLVNSNADVKLSFSLVAAALAVASSSLLSPPPVLVLSVLAVLVAVDLVLSCLTCAVARCVTASPVRSNDTIRRSLNVDVAAKNGFDDDVDASVVVVDVVVLPFPSPVVLLLAVGGIFAIVGLLEPLVVVLLFVSLVVSPEKGFVVGRRFVHIIRSQN